MSEPGALNLVLEDEEAFQKIIRLVAESRTRAMQTVNFTLIELYWQVGQTTSEKIEAAEWGDGIVKQLAGSVANGRAVRTGYCGSE